MTYSEYMEAKRKLRTARLERLLDKIQNALACAWDARDEKTIVHYYKYTYVSKKYFQKVEDEITLGRDRVFPLPVLCMEVNGTKTRYKVQRDVLAFFRKEYVI